MLRTESEVIVGVSEQIQWWVRQRREKLVQLSHDTMAVNPLLAPVLMGMHGFADFDTLADFLLGGHLSTGHATGFGKLIDEKILPAVFGTTKLDRSFRRSNAPFDASMFDEIDHIVNHPDGSTHLLCLKAGRWTIQLTMAVQLNAAFREINSARVSGHVSLDSIVLGVIYGKAEDLTDKFAIARGINTGQPHDVVDLTSLVSVRAGREFWRWLNNDEDRTQDWLLAGIIDGLNQSVKQYGSFSDLLSTYKSSFVNRFSKHIDSNGVVDWHAILREISG